MSDDHLHRRLACLGNTPVHRLGLACNYGITGHGLRYAVEDRGLNFIFWTPRMRWITPTLRDLLKSSDRRLVVASMVNLGYMPWMVRRSLEQSLRALGVDAIDIFLLGWLGVATAGSDAVLDQMRALRQAGKVRAIGCSIHNRPQIGRASCRERV